MKYFGGQIINDHITGTYIQQTIWSKHERKIRVGRHGYKWKNNNKFYVRSGQGNCTAFLQLMISSRTMIINTVKRSSLSMKGNKF